MIPRTPYTGLASATSANGTARNGASLSTEFAAPGGIAVQWAPRNLRFGSVATVWASAGKLPTS